MADEANVTQPTDAYRNINNPAAGEGKQDGGITSTQRGEGAVANEDPTKIIGGGLVVGEIAQPLRGQPGWQGLTSERWVELLDADNNNHADPSPGRGAVSTTGAWNDGAGPLDTNVAAFGGGAQGTSGVLQHREFNRGREFMSAIEGGLDDATASDDK